MKKTVLALGYFDGLHLGHAALLRACRAMGDTLGCDAAVVTFQNHPDALVFGKAPPLIMPNVQRDRLMQTEFGMDRVISLPFDYNMMTLPWENFFRMLQNTYHAAGIVCGHDFRFGNRGAGNGALLSRVCREARIPCVVIPAQRMDNIVISSTYIRQLLSEGKTMEAARFLGRPHRIVGTVQPGRKLGRTLGIPTANLPLPPGTQPLRFGVYATKVWVEGESYTAVTNVGSRPTVGGHHVTVESWLMDYEGELYGKTLSVDFYAFLRPEEKFPSLTDLQQEIRKNAIQAQKFFENL